jgi:hypothetical protein
MFVCWFFVWVFMREYPFTILEDIPSAFDLPTTEVITLRRLNQFPRIFRHYCRRNYVRLGSVEDQGERQIATPYTDDDAISMAS